MIVSNLGSTAPPVTAVSVLRSPRRIALAVLGLLCVGLALAGIVVPGMPTTVFLIAASYLFTKSCPWLEERLVRHRVFRAYAPYLDGSRPIPSRARWIALGMMWTAVASSVAVLVARGPANPWIVAGIVAAAIVGTIVIQLRSRP